MVGLRSIHGNKGAHVCILYHFTTWRWYMHSWYRSLWTPVSLYTMFADGLVTQGLMISAATLLPSWRHNGRNSVRNHQPHDCLRNRLFRRRSKKTSKLRVTGLCAGNSPGTGEFPAQMASKAENASIWWRHHACVIWFLGNQIFVNPKSTWSIYAVILRLINNETIEHPDYREFVWRNNWPYRCISLTENQNQARFVMVFPLNAPHNKQSICLIIYKLCET